MATNLHRKLAGGLEGYGTELAVWNRTLSKAEPLKTQGAQVVHSLAQLGDTDIVFSISSDDTSATQVTGCLVLSARDRAGMVGGDPNPMGGCIPLPPRTAGACARPAAHGGPKPTQSWADRVHTQGLPFAPPAAAV